MKKRVIKLLTIYATVAAILGAYAVIVLCFHISIPCIFRKITGLRCPGCGNTRAVTAIARLDFAEALRYNYLFPAEMLYLAYITIYCSAAYLRTGRADLMPKPAWLNIVFLIILCVWWVIRNIFGL